MDLERCPSPATVASHLTSLIKTPVSEHVCNCKTCDIENLIVEIHKSNDRYCIVCKYFKSPWPTSVDTFVQRYYNIYVCKNTGKIHCCHSACDGGRITNDDNCQVCVISGVQYESVMVRSWQISSRCVPTIVQDKRDPNMFSRGEDGRVKNTGIHNIKITNCVMICGDILKRLLFSRKRMQSEMHKHREGRKESEKVVNKYRRYCDRNEKPRVYMNSVVLYMHTMKRKPMFTRLILKTPDDQEEIIKRYTMELIAYWKMFIHKTIPHNSTFSFKIFVPACLYIMRNGLFIHGTYIIKKSRYLESALPEANGLHMYSINKPTLTNGQKHIVRAIRDTVESKKTTPTELKDYCEAEYNKISI